MLEVVLRELSHGRSGPSRLIVGNGIVAAQSVGEENPSALLSLVERQQWAVLTDRFAPRRARLPVPILHDVAFDTRRFDANPKAGKLDVPNDVLRRLPL